MYSVKTQPVNWGLPHNEILVVDDADNVIASYDELSNDYARSMAREHCRALNEGKPFKGYAEV